MSNPRLRWRPELFAALGAKFEADPTVKDGTHLRWFSDARLGMAVRGTSNKYNVFCLRMKEPSIADVDLFNPSTEDLPVHSSALTSSAGRIMRDGDTLCFQRPIDHKHWSSLRQYFSQRQRLDLSTTTLPDKEQALLDYTDGVLKALDLRPGSTLDAECEQVVAVDIRFDKPSTSTNPGFDLGSIPDLRGTDLTIGFPDNRLPNFRRPDLTIGLPINRTPNPPRTDLGAGPRDITLPTDGLNTTLDALTRGRVFNFGELRPWFNRLHANVEAYDDCDRLVASDWVGFESGVGWRLTARLRAPGITSVKILHRPALQVLRELETRWVFCDEFASADKLWIEHSETAFEPDPGSVTGQFLKDRVFAAFHTNRNWSDLAGRVRDKFMSHPSFQAAISAPDTFASFGTGIKLEDEAGAQPGDPQTSMSLLPSLLAAAVDPAVANLLGLHTFSPHSTTEGSGIDWKIEAALPFFDRDNLQSLEAQLRSLQPNNGIPFFHTAQNPLTELRLAGLVVNTKWGEKPVLPKAVASATAASMVIATGEGSFSQLVNAVIETGGPKKILELWQTPACYEVIRSVTDEPSQNIVSQDGAGPLDDFGVIPDVVLPQVDATTCLTTGRISDVFSVPADKIRKLVYDIRAFDIFGRPSAIATTDPIELQPPCRAPAAPNLINNQIIAQGDQQTLQLDFAIPKTIRSSIHAVPSQLAITLLSVDASDTRTPDQLRWTAARTARQIEFAYEASGERINITPSSSCLVATWNADELELSASPETNCSVRFPGTLNVSQEVDLPESYNGMEIYRLIVPLGSSGLYTAGTNAWAVRASITGICPIDNSLVTSAVAVSKATHFIRPIPPPIRQPDLTRLPLSTRSDHHGHSYYSIDLRDFLAPANQTDDSLVKVLLVRLDRLTNNPEDFVIDGNVLDMSALLALAKGKRERFSLLTDPPGRFDSTQIRIEIPVPGDLEAVYIVAVVGTTPFLEESLWRDAGVTAFRTPPRVNAPALSWEAARIGKSRAGFFIEHHVIARFSESLQDPLQAPKLQIMRRSLSISDQPAHYLMTVDGTSEDALAAEPTFSFNFVDRNVRSWQRYEYSGQLLGFITDREQHVRVGAPITRLIDSPWDQVSDPFRVADPLIVTPHTDGGFALEANFEPGEFDLSIQKITEAGVQPSVATVIRGAQVMDDRHFDLDPKTIYTLRFHDDDTEPGTYVLRLALGQQRVWATRAQTP